MEFTKTEEYKKLYLCVFSYFKNNYQTISFLLEERESLAGKSLIDLLDQKQFSQALNYVHDVLMAGCPYRDKYSKQHANKK